MNANQVATAADILGYKVMGAPTKFETRIRVPVARTETTWEYRVHFSRGEATTVVYRCISTTGKLEWHMATGRQALELLAGLGIFAG